MTRNDEYFVCTAQEWVKDERGCMIPAFLAIFICSVPLGILMVATSRMTLLETVLSVPDSFDW